MENRELSIWDMFWAICLKWRVIVISMIVFAALMGAFSYHKSYTAVQAEKQSEMSLEDVVLSDEEQYFADSYLGYKDVYDKQVKYNEESEILRLQANRFYLLSLDYYIDNNYVVEYPAIDKYNNVDAIAHAYKMGVSNANLGELVDCDNSYGSIKSDEGAVFTISIYGDSEEECYALANQVKSIVEESYSTVEKQFGEHEVQAIAESCVLTSDIAMLDVQKAAVDRLNVYGKLVMDMEAKLTPNAKLYVELYERENKTEDETENSVSIEKQNMKATVSKKYILLGAIMGAFLAVFAYALGYIFNAKIQYEDDFERLYGIHVIGRVKSEDKKKLFGVIDRFIENMRNINRVTLGDEENVDMLVVSLLLQARKYGVSDLVLSGRLYTDRQKKMIERISNGLKKKGINITCTDSVLYDVKALEQNEQSKKVVLLECAGWTKYEWIKQEIVNNRFYGVDILGAVVVK